MSPEDTAVRTFLSAADESNIETFLSLALPPEWSGIRARILETGVTMSRKKVPWAPRWSQVSLTVRKDRAKVEDPRITSLKSIIFRVHDCLHQLWGLPHPKDLNSIDDFTTTNALKCVGKLRF